MILYFAYDGNPGWVKEDVDGEPKLADVRRWLDGGYFEVLLGRYMYDNLFQLVVDESGLLKELPVNKAGTVYYWAHCMGPTDVLHGPVILLTGRNLLT